MGDDEKMANKSSDESKPSSKTPTTKKSKKTKSKSSEGSGYTGEKVAKSIETKLGKDIAKPDTDIKNKPKEVKSTPKSEKCGKIAKSTKSAKSKIPVPIKKITKGKSSSKEPTSKSQLSKAVKAAKTAKTPSKRKLSQEKPRPPPGATSGEIRQAVPLFAKTAKISAASKKILSSAGSSKTKSCKSAAGKVNGKGSKAEPVVIFPGPASKSKSAKKPGASKKPGAEPTFVEQIIEIPIVQYIFGETKSAAKCPKSCKTSSKEASKTKSGKFHYKDYVKSISKPSGKSSVKELVASFEAKSKKSTSAKTAKSKSKSAKKPSKTPAKKPKLVAIPVDVSKAVKSKRDDLDKPKSEEIKSLSDRPGAKPRKTKSDEDINKVKPSNGSGKNLLTEDEPLAPTQEVSCSEVPPAKQDGPSSTENDDDVKTAMYGNMSLIQSDSARSGGQSLKSNDGDVEKVIDEMSGLQPPDPNMICDPNTGL